MLPEELVGVLERELLLLPVRVRLEALVAAADLVSQWSDLLADHEKLLGHLVLAHGAAPEPGVPRGRWPRSTPASTPASGPGHA